MSYLSAWSRIRGTPSLLGVAVGPGSADRKNNLLGDLLMKKHLIAAGVVAAFAAPAMAQNVTVYGIVDAAIQSFDNGTSSYTRNIDGAIATSRLGVRGTEDLGGGLKANFQLEGQLRPNTGAMGATTTTTANQIFNREAWAGISGGWGEIRIGVQDVTYTQDIDSGTSQAGNLSLSAGINTGNTAPVNGELGSDQTNVIKYISPTFAGFSFQVGYASGNNFDAATDAAKEQYGLFGQYSSGPLKVMLGVHSSNNQASATDAGATTTDKKSKIIGASYDFGFMSVGGHVNKGEKVASGDRDVTIQQASARVPLANGFAAHLVVARGEVKNVTNAEGSGYTLAVTKALSKRTSLYGAYTSTSADPAATFSMTGVGVASASNVQGADRSAVTLGMVHSF